METGRGTTSQKLYSARRGNFQYVASWEFDGPLLKWTAVVTAGNGFLKLLMGQSKYVNPDADLRSLVRRKIEERIDLQAWADD